MPARKRCFKCGETKDFSEFYRHKQMADGHLGKCKQCTQSDVSVNRSKNIDRVRDYDRKRASLPHRRANVKTVGDSWRAEHPERRVAQNSLNNAIRGGAVVRPEQCERCPATSRIEAHHEDYSRPLDVDWLCKPCHAKADAERRERESMPVAA